MREERRGSPRIIGSYELALRGPDGAEDLYAVAHDVSTLGFRAETSAKLSPGGDVAFELQLPGAPAAGRGRVVWAMRTQAAWWIGVEFTALDRAQRRRLARLASPERVDWELILDKAWRALTVMTGAAAVWAGIESWVWRQVFRELWLVAVACLALGWSLFALLGRPRD